MNESFKFVHYEKNKIKNKCSVEKFGVKTAKKVSGFHKSFPEYMETPLVKLDSLSKHYGVKGIYVKDESYRFGLNAFKVLGGSYAIGSYIANKLNVDIDEMPYNIMTSDATKARLGEITFVTATDGNHGRGIAWTANRLKQKSVVYMPKGSAIERLNNILEFGSDASITDMNYDDAVRLANTNAEKFGWVMVQDTAWEGYEDIPAWIMQGYTTLISEAITQLEGKKPTHVFLQAGVGALAGGITGFITDYYKEEKPIITIVEPNKADCIYKSALADDGKPRFVTGDMDTIMAGLACGEPCTVAWKILHDHADNFISMPDWVAAQGMRILGNPLGGDRRIVSGESGAATMGFVSEVLTNKNLANIKETLKLNEESLILCISTEGDTDKQGYRDIVWNGKYIKK